jgi:hypothetical protein
MKMSAESRALRVMMSSTVVSKRSAMRERESPATTT